MRPTRTAFAGYNAVEFYRALDAGRLYPEAWVHLATWWRLTGLAPEWPARPSGLAPRVPRGAPADRSLPLRG